MAKLSFKVYLMNDDSSRQSEVRRFGIDEDVATNYVYLREKLQTIFPELRGRNFTITWKDQEKESITILANDELEIALYEMSKDPMLHSIFKLYVIVQTDKNAEYTNKPENVLNTQHPGVICDMCDKDIYGIRFKCMQCPDYDLCFDCMTLGYHPEHYMVRMTEPIEWSSCHGRRLTHHMRKFMKKAAHDERRHKSSKRGGNGSNSCPMFHGPGGKFTVGPLNASVIDSLLDFIVPPSSDECAEQKQSKEQRRDPSTEAATEATENPQQQETKIKFSQLMKMLEQNFSNISQFLDPLVTVVDESAKQSKPAKNGAQDKAEAQKPAESANETKKFPGKGKKLCDDNTEKVTPSDDATSQKETVASCSAEQAAEAEEWTMVQRESPNISRTSSASSSLNGAIPKAAASAPAVEPVKIESPKQSIYPPLPSEVRHEFYHPNPKIQSAVETMMAMGFSNEGGWLTHLLISKDGDISQALDVLQPVRHH